jgi:hypothetical protein
VCRGIGCGMIPPLGDAMDFPDLTKLETWTDGAMLVLSAPQIIWPMILGTGLAIWGFRGIVEKAKQDGLNGQIAGLNTQLAVRQERLTQAKEQEAILSAKLEKAEEEIAKLQKQFSEKASTQALFATANSTATLIGDIRAANTILQRTLAGVPGIVEVKGGDVKLSATKPSGG